MNKLLVLMVTAFVDMIGLLIVLPLLPFYALEFGGGGLEIGILVAAYAVAQLLSAPLWGSVSDRYGRRPAILISLGASIAAYLVFAVADSLLLLFISRLVQGAGGGTTGVVQAYVADTSRPRDRARHLGWLSAATSLGVMVGPALGSFSLRWGTAAPGVAAALLCTVNLVFAWAFLRESRVPREGGLPADPFRSWKTLRHTLCNPAEPAPRLIWIYGTVMMAFQGMVAVLALFLALRFEITEETIGYVFVYTGLVSVVTRGALLGPVVDRLGEVRLSRIGCLLLAVGLAALPFTSSWLALGAALTLVPLGTAFTFPCVTALLSRVIEGHERGLFMGVQQSFGGMARVIGPIAAGWAWDALGPGPPFWAGVVLVGIALLLSRSVESAAPDTLD